MKKAALLGIVFLSLVSFTFAAETTDEAAKPETTEVAPAPAAEPAAEPVADEQVAPETTEPAAPVAMETGEPPVAEPPVEETVTMAGVVVDNLCAGMQTPEALPEFVKTHTKQCALKLECAASGYSIFSDGKLYKFDKESNAKIEEFLKKEDSKTQVSVTVKKVGEELSLVTIENQIEN